MEGEFFSSWTDHHKRTDSSFFGLLKHHVRAVSDCFSSNILYLSVIAIAVLRFSLLLPLSELAIWRKERKITAEQNRQNPVVLQLFLFVKNWRHSCSSKRLTIGVVAGLAPLAEIEDGEIVFDASGNRLVHCSPDSSLNGKPHLMLWVFCLKGQSLTSLT